MNSILHSTTASILASFIKFWIPFCILQWSQYMQQSVCPSKYKYKYKWKYKYKYKNQSAQGQDNDLDPFCQQWTDRSLSSHWCIAILPWFYSPSLSTTLKHLLDFPAWSNCWINWMCTPVTLRLEVLKFGELPNL